MAGAAPEPPVQPVGKCARIRYCDKDRTARPHYAAQLLKSRLKVFKVFQAVIGDDGIEGSIRKREAGCVSLHEI